MYTTKLDIPFPKKTPEWASIKEYQAIRNRITHSGGYVLPSWKLLNSAKAKGIVVSNLDEHRLELTKGFCNEALDNFQKFMLGAILAADKGMP